MWDFILCNFKLIIAYLFLLLFIIAIMEMVVNDYKEKKINQIKETTLLLAQRAKTLCYDVEMQPMSSYERMIVHTIIEKEEGLTTESIGKGKERRVVIKYVG